MTNWKKRAEELSHEAAEWMTEPYLEISDALQLGQEMADARAEEIEEMMDATASCCDHGRFAAAYAACAKIARNTIDRPKTREQRMEEALTRILRSYSDMHLIREWAEDALKD